MNGDYLSDVERDVRNVMVREINDVIRRRISLLDNPAAQMGIIGSAAKNMLVSIYVTMYANADDHIKQTIKPQEFCDAFCNDLRLIIADVDEKLRNGQLDDLVDRAMQEAKSQ
jgi:hypothetical protein